MIYCANFFVLALKVIQLIPVQVSNNLIELVGYIKMVANAYLKNTSLKRVSFKKISFLTLLMLLFPIKSMAITSIFTSNLAFTTLEKTSNYLPEKESYMIDFSSPTEHQNWFVTNDNVMGGKSLGGINFKGASTVFSGEISLDNNGGFSSVFRPISPLPSGLDIFELDVEGDGLTYQFRVIIFVNGYRLAYKHDFQTIKDQRNKITLNIADFKASFRGRIIEGAPTLYAEKIKQIGFLVTNKKAGPFSIALNNIVIK
ncbi:MAG: CIA30 family protein [Colwellia sp.]